MASGVASSGVPARPGRLVGSELAAASAAPAGFPASSESAASAASGEPSSPSAAEAACASSHRCSTLTDLAGIARRRTSAAQPACRSATARASPAISGVSTLAVDTSSEMEASLPPYSAVRSTATTKPWSCRFEVRSGTVTRIPTPMHSRNSTGISYSSSRSSCGSGDATTTRATRGRVSSMVAPVIRGPLRGGAPRRGRCAPR